MSKRNGTKASEKATKKNAKATEPEQPVETTEAVEGQESGAESVEQIPDRSYEESVIALPIEDILVDETFNARKKYDPAEIASLAADIKHQGLINPIAVRRVTVDGTERFSLTAGYRRMLALKKLGAKRVVATVHGWDDVGAKLANLSENVGREDLTAGELAMRIEELHDQDKLTYAQIAKRIGKSPAHVENLARILKNGHPTIKKLFLEGDNRWAAPTPTLKFCLSVLTLEPDEQMKAYEAEYGSDARKAAESGEELGDGEEKPKKKSKRSSAGEPKMQKRDKVETLLANLNARVGATLKGVSGDDADITERDRKVLRRFLKWILGLEESYPLNVPVDDDGE